MLRNWFKTSLVPVLWAAPVLAGCGSGADSPGPGPNPATLTAAKASSSGDGQSGGPGQPLAQPIRIVVTRGGTPEAGVGVTWTAGGSGASLAPASGTTDATGIASSVWTLGQEQGAQAAQAAVTGAAGSPVSFTATAVGGGGAGSATVVLRTAGGNRFDPSAVTIGVGGTVTWIWGDGVHDVTSSGSPSFPSSGIANGPPRSYPVTFSAAGVYQYECTVHNGMTGRVTVQ